MSRTAEIIVKLVDEIMNADQEIARLRKLVEEKEDSLMFWHKQSPQYAEREKVPAGQPDPRD